MLLYLSQNMRHSSRYRRDEAIKALLKRLGSVILVFVIVALVLGLLLPFLVGGTWVMILSGSMTPALQTGGLALAWPVNPTVIKISDIITYEAQSDPDILVAHRVIEVLAHESPSFQTKGDANEEPDSYIVEAKHVTGKILFHIPHLGYAIDYTRDLTRTRLGFGLLLGAPGALIIGAEIKNIISHLNPWKKRRKLREERERKRIEARRRGRLWSKLW